MELVDTIVAVCRAVKGGILCFFPSYAMLTSLDTVRLKRELRGRKVRLCVGSSVYCLKIGGIQEVFTEPRQSGGLEGMFNDYRKVAQHPRAPCDGPLMLGVYRGKVSEGIDFADEMARCVIAVSIPFPNFKDQQVTQKRIFNDKMRMQNSKIIPGDKWYRMEGFRALNQALGRLVFMVVVLGEWGIAVLMAVI